MKTIHILIALSIICLWGINFSFMKMGLAEIDPFILTGLRFFLAAMPAVFFIKKPQVSFKLIALYGLTFGVGLWGTMTLAINAGISPGMASLLLQSSAFISVLIGVLFLKEKISSITSFGLATAIIGLALIMTLQDGSVTPLGIVLVLLAAIAMSLSFFIVKKAQIKEMFSFIVWSCLFASAPLFLLSLVTVGGQGFIDMTNNISGIGVFSVLVQAYPVTLIGYYVWNRLVAIYPMSTLAPFTLLIPVFGLLGSMYFYNESITGVKFIACLLITAGILVNTFESRLQRALLQK